MGDLFDREEKNSEDATDEGPHVTNAMMLVSPAALGTKANGSVFINLIGHLEGAEDVSLDACWRVHWSYNGTTACIKRVTTISAPYYDPALIASGFPSIDFEPTITTIGGCPHIAVAFGGVNGQTVDADLKCSFLQVGGA